MYYLQQAIPQIHNHLQEIHNHLQELYRLRMTTTLAKNNENNAIIES